MSQPKERQLTIQNRISLIYTSNVEKIKEEILRFISEGADINGYDEFDQSPLAVAVEHNSLPLITFLIGLGVNVNLCDPLERKTSLHIAASENFDAAIKILVDAGAKVDVENDIGETPLHVAARDGNIEVVRVLLESGADLSKRTRFTNETPFQLTSAYHLDAMKLCYDVDFVKQSELDCALLKCCTALELPAIKFTLDAGARIDFEDVIKANCLHKIVEASNDYSEHHAIGILNFLRSQYGDEWFYEMLHKPNAANVTPLALSSNAAVSGCLNAFVTGIHLRRGLEVAKQIAALIGAQVIFQTKKKVDVL